MLPGVVFLVNKDYHYGASLPFMGARGSFVSALHKITATLAASRFNGHRFNLRYATLRERYGNTDIVFFLPTSSAELAVLNSQSQ